MGEIINTVRWSLVCRCGATNMEQSAKPIARLRTVTRTIQAVTQDTSLQAFGYWQLQRRVFSCAGHKLIYLLTYILMCGWLAVQFRVVLASIREALKVTSATNARTASISPTSVPGRASRVRALGPPYRGRPALKTVQVGDDDDVSFIISKAIALQLDYKSRLHKTQKNNKWWWWRRLLLLRRRRWLNSLFVDNFF